MYEALNEKERPRRRRRRRIKIWKILLILVIIVLLAYPFWEASRLELEEYKLSVSDLPQNLRNVSIVFATDFHHSGSMKGSRSEEIIAKINALSPDLVLLGGDYADSTEGAIAFFTDLPSVWARMGVYAVLGDKEYTNPEKLSELIGVMTGRGIIPLVNASDRVKVGQSYITIIGLADYNGAVPHAEELAATVSEEDFVIALSHSPDVIPSMQKAYTADGSSHWYDLALFGHTHGGQINLFGMTPFFTLNPSVAGSRYLQGWLEESRAALLVSNGIGTEFLPVRLGAKPQLHYITLKSR